MNSQINRSMASELVLKHELSANMRTRWFMLATLIVSAFIWYKNFFYREEELTDLNPDTQLVVSPGKMHIIVTGGAGFIGSHAALHLLDLGHSVTVIDNLSRGNLGAILQIASLHAPQYFKFHNADLGNQKLLSSILLAAHPAVDLVMHFAAIAYVGESVAQPLLYYHNITVNTINLLEAMRASNINKFVYSSTCAVYGNQAQLPITEETTPQPTSPYGMSKLFAEQVIKAHASATPDFKAIILRYFNVYGNDPEGRLVPHWHVQYVFPAVPHWHCLIGMNNTSSLQCLIGMYREYPRSELRKHSRISGACLDAATGQLPSLTVIGTKHPTSDGTCIRDYIHVTDLVAAHVTAMHAVANPPALYNVGTGQGLSVRQFVTACKKVTGVDIKVVEQAESRPGDYPEMWADPSKIKRELGWKPLYVDVELGLAHAWAWRKSHPSGYQEYGILNDFIRK
ncbi:hypothetical protein CEUSTIGMA_g9998.t1 [Chlamydomonas eustigma]|uniref:Uncharacterized protein n=1 Tax=Chlamydomonas eustigma TaxID=1157962 RepID=A0A250XI32_9CHLO|nr:hypothetical protein CEUSTIGMA_g9998.t1 [Chlamydomonas eustigma]|eukprot:GAX82572.1 hypothetical protein CEUSTIGMA_g9998.t1 [Chlamydomonas eustigma]